MRISSVCLPLALTILSSSSGTLIAQSASYQSSHIPGRISANFTHFNAMDKVSLQVNQGDILFINWRITVTKGTVTVFVTDKRKQIYKSNAITKNDTADFYIPIHQTGDLSIKVKGRKSVGNILLFYEKAASKPIQVLTKPNIELFGLMMQLDNAPDAIALKDSVEINGRKTMWKDWYALAVKNYYRFKTFDSCHMMQLYRQYMSKGLYNDFFIALLLQADQVPNSGVNNQMDEELLVALTGKSSREEASIEATAFFKAFNQFYQEIRFDEYLKEYASYLKVMKDQVTKNLPPAAFVTVMEHFYHKQFNGYYMVPGFDILNTMGFGKMNRKAGEITNAFGPFDFMKFDENNPDPGFDFPEKIQNLSLHEFGHSFVNPAIDKLPAELLRSTEHLYLPIKDIMSKHAYTQWQMCLYEHFVKAGEILITRYMGQKEKADGMMSAFIKDGFIYIPFIVTELEQYEKIPVEERDYDSFVIKVMEHLRDTSQFK